MKSVRRTQGVHSFASAILFSILCTFSLLGQAQPLSERYPDIHAELVQMADDYLGFREMQGFNHDMNLAEAYRWQDEMVRIMAPTMGGIVGYKAGGHDSGPGFPTFPSEGIRGIILEGMMRPSGTRVGLEQFRRGFLEADIAFRVGDASINEAETDLELLAALDAFIPFAEIPDPLYEVTSRSVNGTVVANMSTRMSFAGEPVPLQSHVDTIELLNNLEFAVLDENDAVIQSGTLAGWFQPLAVIRWLRDHLVAAGKTLEPGDLLSLGNIGIIRQLHEGSPRGPAYTSNQFRLEYYGLIDEGPATVTINIDR